MISGFKKAGIYPFYRYEVFSQPTILIIVRAQKIVSTQALCYMIIYWHPFQVVKVMAMQLVSLLTQQISMEVVISVITVKQLKRSYFSQLKRKPNLFIDMKRNMT